MIATGLNIAKAKAWEVTDDFCSRVEPLIPVRQRVAEQAYTRKTDGGRKPKDPRLVFEGIMYVLGAGGRHCPPSVGAVPARFMHDSLSGKEQAYMKPCGNSVLRSATNLKVSLGDGKVLTGP